MLVVKSLVWISHSVSTLKLLGYIDPSTGSLVFQAIAASIISGALFVRAARDRIVWLITAGWRTGHRSKSAKLSDICNDRSNDTPKVINKAA